MLFLLLFAVAAVVGIIIMGLYVNSYNDFWDSDVWLPVSAGLAVLGTVGVLLSCVLCVRVQVMKDVDYQAALNEREALVYRLEHKDDNTVGNERLYSEITEFNNSLLVTKKWAGDPWVGCFYNAKIAELDYIEYKEG